MNTPYLPQDSGPEGTEPPSDEVLAGEFVLGVVGSAQHRELLGRMASDRAFAQLVTQWEQRFAPWLTGIEPVDAPPQMWNRICLSLGWKPNERAEIGFWQRLGVWRLATVMSVVVALFALVWAINGSRPQPPVALTQAPAVPAATAVTPLNHDDGTPGWLASVDPAHGTVLVVPVPSAPDSQGRVPELWIIPAGKAPRSLGAVSINQSGTVSVPADVRAALVAGSVLAVTLEPAAGIPHAAPSGPIVAKGAI